MKISRSLWQYHRDKAFINNDRFIIDVPDDPDSSSFKFKQKITGQTRIDGTRRCSNNDTIKIVKQFLQNSGNATN